MIEPSSISPGASAITLAHSGNRAFHVDLLQPAGGSAANVAWLVDGVPVSGEIGDGFNLSTTPGLPIPAEIKVRVQDLTGLVLPDMGGASLHFEHSWSVT